MSGGSYDYLCYKIDDMADRLVASKDPLRRAFGKHLLLVSKAAKSVEWVDSGDYGPGDEREDIAAVLGDIKGAVLKELVAEAASLIERLQKAVDDAKCATEEKPE